MQQEIPDDYIICSGKSISLKEILWYIFDKLEISRDKIVINQDHQKTLSTQFFIDILEKNFEVEFLWTLPNDVLSFFRQYHWLKN